MKFITSLSEVKKDYIYLFKDRDTEFIGLVVKRTKAIMKVTVLKDDDQRGQVGLTLDFESENLSKVEVYHKDFSSRAWALYEKGSVEDYPEYYL